MFLCDSGEQRLHSDIFLALIIKSQFRVKKSILHGTDLESKELILILTAFSAKELPWQDADLRLNGKLKKPSIS